MGILLRQSIINSIIYYFRILIISFNVIWLYPRICSLEEIGLYKFILSSVTLIVTVIEFGLPQSIIKYIYEFPKNQGVFFTFIFIVGALIFGTFSFILFLCKPYLLSYFAKKSLNFSYFYLILACSLAFFYSIIIKSFLRAYYQSVFPTFTQNIVFYILIGLNGVLYHNKFYTFDTSLRLIFFIYLFCVLLNLFYLWYINKLNFSFDFKALKLNFIKSFVKFNFYTLASHTKYIIATKIDSIMIVSMLGLKENGLYATVVIIAKIIEIPRRGVRQISMPILSKLLFENRKQEVSRLYKKISQNQFNISAVIFCILVVNLDSIFLFFPSKIYVMGKSIVIILGLTKLVDSFFSMGSDVIITSKYYKFNLISVFILVFLCISMNFIFIPLFGINGAAIATMISYIIFNLFNCFYVYIKFNIHPFSLETIYSLNAILLTLLISIYLPNFSKILILNLISKTIFTCSIYFGVFYFLKNLINSFK